MPNIHVLDQSTINKIAAGEVIERPASVVKELLENAIDARATAVTVEIRDGGISFIRVTDNGCGIPREELPMAFLRHSTSKIQSVEDLFTVSSLGFRGEALSSIAAVSQVEVITKTADCLTGSRYQIEGGAERGLEEIGSPDGTTFIARNLFYNTPVRRKFLKTPATEGSHVADLVEKIALSHPEISIRFIQNNQNKLHTSGNHNVKDIIYTVFGREIASNLLPVDSRSEAVSVTGFAGKPVIARNNRNFENYFINGRYIKSGIVCKAIEEAYKPYMMQHKYPFTLLHFSIEPEFLDVNVHPTKMELRFRDGELIFRMVRDAVAQALGHKELIPRVELDEKERQAQEREAARASREKRIPVPEPFERRRLMQAAEKDAASFEPKTERYLSPAGAGFGDRELLRERPAGYGVSAGSRPSETGSVITVDEELTALLKSKPGTVKEASGEKETEPLPSVQEPLSPVQQQISPAQTPEKERDSRQLDLFEEKLLDNRARSRHRLIGQLFDTYWLVEFSQNLYIIDQHAAHEKVLYERTMATLKTRQYTCQQISPPIILTLGSREELMLKEHLKCFTDIGFEIEPFGGREYAVRGVPDNLFSIAKKELLMEMLDNLAEDTISGGASLIYEKVASMSCKAAVKGNRQMSFQEADRLIDELLTLENPYACPHGRPTIISMSKYELEKKFKRIV
ncbi:MAG: DNA mismatch repair endonuclease MutL [Eubacteriales bacterium]|nr:DNA mismatch repair endonuclease MutL [Eubacteriales bacterium]